MTIDTDALPPSLAARAQRAWEGILEAASESEHAALNVALADRALASQCALVLACSCYVAESFRRRPWLLEQLLVSGVTGRPLHAEELHTELGDLLQNSSEELGVQLRRFRQRHMVRIIWRDLNRLAPTMETTRDVSWLAEACIAHALAHCRGELEGKFGIPMGKYSGAPQELIVIAMGKLGARELNLSSDIDLIFAYPEGGQTEGARRSLSNEEFFTRLGRALIAALDAVTAEGFVFRVDMRLRPYGESGALAHSYAALEAYYQEQGRDWERYAMVKARALTGSAAAVDEFEELRRPFVYRRYVDYSAIESLRSMKQLIVAEVRRRDLSDNVKLGGGGIREVEFIAQCFQLIRGGRDLALQQRELLPVLRDCAALGCLPQETTEQLAEAYLFLRDAEHGVQAWEDRQTQELPQDDTARAALAHSMGYADFAAFHAALEANRARVSRHFGELIAVEGEQPETPTSSPLWGASCDEQELADLGFTDPAGSSERIEALFNSRRVQTLQAEGRERLDRFMPQLLRACGDVDKSDLALERLLPLVASVARRSAYLLMLIENPPALADLVALCAASPWMAESLASRPALLDELLDRASLYSVPERQSLHSELREQLLRISNDDLEANMEALRYFKASQVLRVAASELAGRLPLMQVSDKLSFIAEACLEEVLHLAWAQLVDRYGEPTREGDGYGFAILGYGKLGGIELSYASDLDLVFVYDAPDNASTRGDRAVENSVFYTRLGQRIIHILEARMSLGQLYEADMRLRPSGASGLLVSSLEAYTRYQREDAWIWEQQALVRARAITGDVALMERLEQERRERLGTARDGAALAREVTRMREKMRKHAGVTASSETLDLKQGCGAIVDVEFMVQYAVLAWAAQEPELARWSDNVRILETLAATGHLPTDACERLTDAYLTLRSATHELALQQGSAVVPRAVMAKHADVVIGCWRTLFATEPGDSSILEDLDLEEGSK